MGETSLGEYFLQNKAGTNIASSGGISRPNTDRRDNGTERSTLDGSYKGETSACLPCIARTRRGKDLFGCRLAVPELYNLRILWVNQTVCYQITNVDTVSFLNTGFLT
eukprot:GHVP01012163.1.p1 GENE.GHVP01012163.1~~GHVP01012163.1.p1  ORF type:complete len:108 (-),score=5.71 GHVP01012163.1:193-516(-)